jgi:hypothetical protein
MSPLKLVHADLKPEHVLVDGQQRILAVLDFGCPGLRPRPRLLAADPELEPCIRLDGAVRLSRPRGRGFPRAVPVLPGLRCPRGPRHGGPEGVAPVGGVGAALPWSPGGGGEPARAHLGAVEGVTASLPSLAHSPSQRCERARSCSQKPMSTSEVHGVRPAKELAAHIPSSDGDGRWRGRSRMRTGVARGGPCRRER